MARVVKYKWYVYRGRRANLKLDTTIMIDGVEYTLGQNDKVIMVVRGGGVEVLRKEVTGSTNITLEASDTDGLTASETRYKYDVYVLTASNPVHEIQLIEKSDFVLLDTNDNNPPEVSA